jgi:hypothetical protein
MNEKNIVPSGVKPSAEVLKKIDDFLKIFTPYETNSGSKLILYFDERSESYYFCCHLEANILATRTDLDASLDANEEDDIYKLNRDITEDEAAFKGMEEDALKGRSFEDMVMEYDPSYRVDKPLKVYGGQHPLRAITKAAKHKGATVHGIRVYFNLSRDQKLEIARVNNTSIAVPNDLLDRMREQQAGAHLRDWCQNVGLLQPGEDFADRRSPNSPTVRVARTLLVNFYLGQKAQLTDFHKPILCKSGGTAGGMDETYFSMRQKMNWSDKAFIDMGKAFARLNKIQRESVSKREQDTNAEFARKALSLAVVSSWAYAAGLFQNDPEALKHHYSIPDSVTAPDDPLNAKALSEAHLKGTDPDTYRGLATRSGPEELGRMLEVFLVLATKATQKRITKTLANAAIQSYEAKKATNAAAKVLGKI